MQEQEQKKISAGTRNGQRRVFLKSRQVPASLKAGDPFELTELNRAVAVHSVVNDTVFFRLDAEDYEYVKRFAQQDAAAA